MLLRDLALRAPSAIEVLGASSQRRQFHPPKRYEGYPTRPLTQVCPVACEKYPNHGASEPVVAKRCVYGSRSSAPETICASEHIDHKRCVSEVNPSVAAPRYWLPNSPAGTFVAWMRVKDI